ncbi:hypothetical protein MN116_006377 [Schistosoma mekongi]|uniref:Uncharacterized protein n=1 Tax=Schistosoma mekongi TaxID=38744 RepID=A0AAE2D4G5_SCHME|nr:hypothetical protein MN116_006377 [Schistosoma mekongi]
MKNFDQSEKLWCFSFMHQLLNKYFKCKIMQSEKNYFTLNENDINLQVRRQQSLNECNNNNNNQCETLLQYSSTTINTTTNSSSSSSSSSSKTYITPEILLHYNPIESISLSKSNEQVNNDDNTLQLWKCPQCSTILQLDQQQKTTYENCQYNQQNKGIRTNPWINYRRIERNNSKPYLPVTSYSISSSLTDSGIYLCTDSGSRCEYITRSTTETDINKNCQVNTYINDIPVIPISSDPPPSPAPKYTQSIITPECLQHTNLSLESNENHISLTESKKTCKGFCKSATFDLSNLMNSTDESIHRPRRRLLTKRVRNQIRRSWLQTTNGTKILPSSLPLESSISSSSSSNSSSSSTSSSSENKTISSIDENISHSKYNKNENTTKKHENEFNFIHINPNVTLNKSIKHYKSQTINDDTCNQSIVTSLFQCIEPELIQSMNINNVLHNSILHSNNIKQIDNNIYDDIQLENLRINLKILSEAKNMINIQMRNLGQNYINYLKNKYLFNIERDQ